MGKVLPRLFWGTELPWVLGGQGDSNNVSSSTEYYNGNNWIISENNYLQEEKFGACATVNRTMSWEDNEIIVLIGGKKTFREVEPFFGDNGTHREPSAQGDRREN